MSSIIGRSAFRATRPLRATATRPLRATGATIKDAAAAQTEDREAGKKSLQRGARRDPELYVRQDLSEKEEDWRRKPLAREQHDNWNEKAEADSQS